MNKNCIALVEENGFKIIGLKKLHLSKAEAEGFYFVHKERPFFNSWSRF